MEFELLIADNGSSDGVKEYARSKADVFIDNGENKGVGHTLNQLIDKASGDYICHIGNDIEMEQDWLKSMAYYQERIEGVCAIHAVQELHKLEEVNGLKVHLGISVFGPKMFRKGRKYQEFSRYGFEDSVLCLEAYHEGLHNYYIPGYSGKHVGEDTKEKTEYREMKNRELEKAQPKYLKFIKKYEENSKARYFSGKIFTAPTIKS